MDLGPVDPAVAREDAPHLGMVLLHDEDRVGRQVVDDRGMPDRVPLRLGPTAHFDDGAARQELPEARAEFVVQA